jgi:ABC-2 type transport system permease protein
VSTTSTQVFNLGLRSITRTLRQPATVIPAVAFPLLLLAVNSSGLSSATKLEGFPGNSYLTFALAIPFMQGALFGAMSAGTNVATDIEGGFLNRLSLTPLSRTALLVGQLAGVVALGLIQGLTFLFVGEVSGAGLAAGPAGALVIIGLSLLITLAFGAIGAFMALRTGSGEAVQGLFPVLFVLLFLSSMSLPRDLIEIRWFRTVATWNPVSYLLEGIRSLLLDGWDGQALARAFLIAGAMAVIAIAASAWALRTRMTRT